MDLARDSKSLSRNAIFGAGERQLEAVLKVRGKSNATAPNGHKG
jgi:hypothetical protein